MYHCDAIFEFFKIEDETKKFATKLGIRTVAVIGGVSLLQTLFLFARVSCLCVAIHKPSFNFYDADLCHYFQIINYFKRYT